MTRCMRLRRALLFSLVGAGIASLCIGAGAAPDAAAKAQELAKVRARIEAVQKDMDARVARRDKVTRELRDVEQQAGKLAREIGDIDRRIGAGQRRLDALDAKRRAEEKALAGERDALARQIRSAYMAGREERLKLLLNQEDPAELGRMLTYYDYFNRARATRIQAVNQHLQRIGELAAEADKELDRQKALKSDRSQALSQLDRTREQRKQVVRDLNAEINAQGDKLARLRRDEKALRDLLDSLHQNLADIPANIDGHVAFASQRGHLPWPVKGRLLARFGQRRSDDALRWRGDLIGAALGDTVHAVAYGRVAYAGWLPHFGLIMILDHGDGYLSLYAHAQSLYRQAGDWVQRGDKIATVGESGGQSEPALYFEIRHERKAVDPRRWLQGAH